VLKSQNDQDKQTKNILTSPTSAAVALSMTMAGAKEATLMEMLKTLRF
jgi:serine protease inhibitor